MKSQRHKLSRRHWLGSVGGAALAAPFLAPRTVHSQDGVTKRLIILYTSNGTIRDNWLPSGSETDWTLSPILQPLAEHKQDMVVIDGLQMHVGGQGNAHHRGFCCALNGVDMVPGPFLDGNNEFYGYHGGITVDQYVAQELASETPFPTLEIAVQAEAQYADTSLSKLSAAGPAQLIPPESDPYRLFDRVFGGIGDTGASAEQIRAEKRSVLDFARADLERLRPRLSDADRLRLDVHAESIRSVERRLQDGMNVGASQPYCELPELEGGLDVFKESNFPIVGRLQTDLMVAALACDQTRIATFMWSQGVSRTVYSWLGHPPEEDHHELSHRGDSDADAQAKLTQINIWLAGEIDYLAKALKAIPDGSGTLFDNTLIVWVNDLSKGNTHGHGPIPYVTLGGAGGAIQGDRFLSYDGRYHNDLLTSICNAMDVPAEGYGAGNHSAGPLPGLVG